MSIDLQIVWRPYKKILSNPLKLVNASSFGVPTIALDENAFKEMGDCYIPVIDFPQFLVKLDELLLDHKKYEEYEEKCIAKSEEYHINNIGKLYNQL